MTTIKCRVLRTGPETGSQRECSKAATGYSADGVAVCAECEDDDTLRIVTPICALRSLRVAVDKLQWNPDHAASGMRYRAWVDAYEMRVYATGEWSVWHCGETIALDVAPTVEDGQAFAVAMWKTHRAVRSQLGK